MDEASNQPIIGYRNLTTEEIDLINEIKGLASQVGILCDKLHADPHHSLDHRWISIGTTHLQQGFMALTRSVAQPTTF